MTVRPLIICGDVSFDFRIVGAGFYFGEVKHAEAVLTDGARYAITKVTGRRIAPHAQVGDSMTVSFAVVINGRDRVVCFEKFSKRWFVEKRVT